MDNEERNRKQREYYQKNKEVLRAKALERYREKGDGAARQREKRAADPNYREKQREYMKSYREGNPTYRKSRRNTDLKKRYGLTLTEYNLMLDEQDHKCFICGVGDPGPKGWCVDHCHHQNKVRAILCRPCNLALGCAKDDPNLLRKMADYVDNFKEI